MTWRIRPAESSDAAAIQAIYAPNVETTAISFELVPPTVDEIATRINRISAQYPWLVCEFEGKVVGYVYACQHRERAAYRWAIDVAVYVDAAHRRQGVARALYTSLIELVRQQGYAQAFAGITLPNPGSVGVHEAVGFRRVAEYRHVGFKLGQWRDVGWWQLDLRRDAEAPNEPIAFRDLLGSPQVAAALAAGTRLLHEECDER